MTTLLELAARHQQQVADLEEQTAERAAGELHADMEALTAGVVAAWMAAFGSSRVRPSSADVAPILARVEGRIRAAYGRARQASRAAIRAGIADAIALGVDQAVAEVSAFEAAPDVSAPDVSDPVLAAALGAQSALSEQMALSLGGLLTVGALGYGALMDAIAKARAGATRVDMAARWAVVRSVADTKTSIADDLGLSRVWAAESDACPICADLAGVVRGTGEPWPTARVRGVSPGWDGAEDPPAHPRCRCIVLLIRVGVAGVAALIDGLRAAAGGGAAVEPSVEPSVAANAAADRAASRRPPLRVPDSVRAVVNRLLRRTP